MMDQEERARQFLPFAALPTEDEANVPYEPRPKKMPKRKELAPQKTKGVPWH